MKTEILYAPSYSLAIISMSKGEIIQAESGAMVSMTEGVDMQTSTKGGVLKGLKRAALGGESLFINTFTAERDAEITMAPAFPGDLRQMRLENETLYVQSGSYMASTGEIDIDTKWGGAKTFFGGEGLFLLKCAGSGEVLVSSYGAIVEREIPAGESYIVDTGHVVAFPEGMTYGVEKAGSWKSTVFGAEGLVVRFQGPGSIWLQTRSPQDLLGWLKANLPANRE
jgi:uncharacterized protein (TIGR00266 family)